MKSMFDMELHLETPLPLEWQSVLIFRFFASFCVQSGQIHFYNTRTHTRTSKDPRRRSPEPPSSGHMSLDLELNLPCDSSARKVNTADHQLFNSKTLRRRIKRARDGSNGVHAMPHAGDALQVVACMP
ncbi:carbon catabolite repressor protein 4-like protein 1-like [Hibiscus syriacus]|uniref:Carbon catabolite repressor protein 4-like protein 1-like n=1 Tax=Hibiscus syriacus TaxID=106335 RepID=A0A6A3BJ33_HIBSY|nr:carbon catabolite repressor protein 4-like protein 1-like [Hibiscus syriacus]